MNISTDHSREKPFITRILAVELALTHIQNIMACRCRVEPCSLRIPGLHPEGNG